MQFTLNYILFLIDQICVICNIILLQNKCYINLNLVKYDMKNELTTKVIEKSRLCVN